MTLERPWDAKNRYPAGVLREYDYWVAEVSYRQHTLGCYILFCKRVIEKFSDLTTEELTDLGGAMKDVENLLLRVPGFVPDRFNYWQMGNKLYHLHIHGIPRYASERSFSGQVWQDTTYGAPPVWKGNDDTHELVAEVRNALLPYFEENRQ